MKKFLWILIFLVLTVTSAEAEDLSFCWNVNTETDLAGYQLFTRLEGTPYDYDDPAWDGPETTCTITIDETQGRWYFVARAYNTWNEESGDSNEIRWPRGDGPSKPGLRFCLNPIP